MVGDSLHEVCTIFLQPQRKKSHSTSLPQALQPGTFCRANSSARGTSSKTRTIRPRTSSGFRECSPLSVLTLSKGCAVGGAERPKNDSPEEGSAWRRLPYDCSRMFTSSPSRGTSPAKRL